MSSNLNRRLHGKPGPKIMVMPDGTDRIPTYGPQTQVPRHVKQAAPKVSNTTQLGGEVAVAIEPAEVCSVFGVDDIDLATGLLRRLLGFLQPDPNKPTDAVRINEALALIADLNPVGSIEAMTATMLVGAYSAAADALRRAAPPDQTPSGRALYQALALKGMRTFAQLLETLHLGRGRAVRQEINVTHTHVTVEPGGKAVLGIDASRGRG